jgi:hypothetical protein
MSNYEPISAVPEASTLLKNPPFYTILNQLHPPPTKPIFYDTYYLNLTVEP